jgi:hypothetical protein
MSGIIGIRWQREVSMDNFNEFAASQCKEYRQRILSDPMFRYVFEQGFRKGHIQQDKRNTYQREYYTRAKKK